MPPGCRVGQNVNAFVEGFRPWEKAGDRKPATEKDTPSDELKEAKGTGP